MIEFVEIQNAYVVGPKRVLCRGGSSFQELGGALDTDASGIGRLRDDADEAVLGQQAGCTSHIRLPKDPVLCATVINVRRVKEH
jgi:hypothetical protein